SHDLIALEGLQIWNLVKHRRLAKAISDAGWARFRSWVEYYGRGQQGPVIAVPPHSTSQQCSGCGTLGRTSLSVRPHVCPDCELLLERDHNAALGIREVGLAQATRQGLWQGVASGTVGHTETERLETARLLRAAARRFVAPAGGTRNLPASGGQSVKEM